MARQDFPEVFGQLRAIMARHAEGLVVLGDEPGDYRLNTTATRADGYVFAFGAVQTKARYVAYHLMTFPLSPGVGAISDALRARMHGKTCFSFTRVEAELFAELDTLTGRAAEAVAAPDFFSRYPSGHRAPAAG
jgi:hypothetical protein